MRVLSLFCGAGGIDQGLKECGIKTTTAIDFNADCCSTFKLNHADTEVLCGSVEDYASTFSNYDIIVGGPPCQPFSRAKLERSLDPKHVNLFWQIVDELKPKYFLMENVKDVNKVCARPSKLINCADYGTPQNRQRRIFTNLSMPEKTHTKPVSIKDAIGFDGLVQDRKTTFGEKYRTDNGHWRERSSERPCFTIVTDYRVWLIKDGIERKATEQEVAVLQGFPKDYKFYGNKKSIKMQIGNAVPSQPVKEIFSQIIEQPCLVGFN